MPLITKGCLKTDFYEQRKNIGFTMLGFRHFGKRQNEHIIFRIFCQSILFPVTEFGT